MNLKPVLQEDLDKIKLANIIRGTNHLTSPDIFLNYDQSAPIKDSTVYPDTLFYKEGEKEHYSLKEIIVIGNTLTSMCEKITSEITSEIDGEKKGFLGYKQKRYFLNFASILLNLEYEKISKHYYYYYYICNTTTPVSFLILLKKYYEKILDDIINYYEACEELWEHYNNINYLSTIISGHEYAITQIEERSSSYENTEAKRPYRDAIREKKTELQDAREQYKASVKECYEYNFFYGPINHYTKDVYDLYIILLKKFKISKFTSF